MAAPSRVRPLLSYHAGQPQRQQRRRREQRQQPEKAPGRGRARRPGEGRGRLPRLPQQRLPVLCAVAEILVPQDEQRLPEAGGRGLDHDHAAHRAPHRRPALPPRQQGPQGLLRFLRLDSDALLILQLILLLGRDVADSALLLALLYIML